MAAQSDVNPELLGELWDLVEEWSSAAIQRARDAASTGSNEVADAEIRVAIAHAAELRALVERHLAEPESVPVEEPATPRMPGTLHEPPQAQVCPECFVVVPLDQLREHELTCERHHKIERMEQAGLGDVDASGFDDATEQPGAEQANADPVVEADEPAAEQAPSSAPPMDAVAPALAAAPVAPTSPDHTCNSADFERPLCDTCGGLHWYCSICGAQRDACRPAAAR